jgi:hypothetical protein
MFEPPELYGKGEKERELLTWGLKVPATWEVKLVDGLKISMSNEK